MIELHKKNIPLYFVSCNFREEQYFFKPYGYWFREQLKNASHFFVQNENSKKLLNSIAIKNVSVSGDTRFDRVVELLQLPKNNEIVILFKENKLLLVSGSTWQADEELLDETTINFDKTKLLIAPHEINENALMYFENKFPNHKTIHYSKATNENVINANILILDSVGILNTLYAYADIAYIGGGFGKSIHNILEPAVFGIPIIFAKNYANFPEAIDLINRKGCKSILNKNEFKTALNHFTENAKELVETGKLCSNYIQEKKGATKMVMEYLEKIYSLSC